MTSDSAAAYYRTAILAQVPRVLGLMDRERLSPTAGCCDRTFWAWKFVDFPRSRFQEALSVLGFLYATPLPESTYPKNPQILEWIELGLRFWASIQHHDGSFDEAYPFERSLAATAFTTFYVGECLRFMEADLSAPTRAVVQHAMARALGPQMASVRSLAALPVPAGGPLHWRVIAAMDTAYLVSDVSVFPATVTAPQMIARGPDNGIIRAASAYPLVRIFWHFARFPVIDYSEQEDGTVVRYVDLRFRWDGHDRSWFDLTLRLDQAGRVQTIEFLNRLFHPNPPQSSALTNGSW